MASPYYGDQSYEAFYAKSRYEQEVRKQHCRQERIKHPEMQEGEAKTCQSKSNAVLLELAGNQKSGSGKSKAGEINQNNRTFGKRLPPKTPSNSWRLSKKAKTMPSPTVNIDPQQDMHLLLIEGSFLHGIDRHEYLSNIYYHQEVSLLPITGRCLDVLPPTKMASGPWIVLSPSEESLTLEQQQDWAGRRIRFASPKAATAKSLSHVRVSPTVDILGSLTVAAFSGFSSNDEFHEKEATLVNMALDTNKKQDWSKTVANLPPFQINNKLFCAGGFSVAINFDPNQNSYYLKIGICETLQEIVCVELVFPTGYQQIPSSASTIGPKLSERNLKRLEAASLEEDERPTSKKRSKNQHGKSNDSWKFDIDTFSVSSQRDRIFSPTQDFPTITLDMESCVSQGMGNGVIDVDNESQAENPFVECDSKTSRKSTTKVAFDSKSVKANSQKVSRETIARIVGIRNVVLPESQVYRDSCQMVLKPDKSDEIKQHLFTRHPNSSPHVFSDIKQQVLEEEFFDAISQLPSDDLFTDLASNGANKVTKKPMRVIGFVFVAVAVVLLVAFAGILPPSRFSAGDLAHCLMKVFHLETAPQPYAFECTTTTPSPLPFLGDNPTASLPQEDSVRFSGAPPTTIFGLLEIYQGLFTKRIGWLGSAVANDVTKTGKVLKNLPPCFSERPRTCSSRRIETQTSSMCSLSKPQQVIVPTSSQVIEINQTNGTDSAFLNEKNQASFRHDYLKTITALILLFAATGFAFYHVTIIEWVLHIST